jgi:hypothetical protein
MRREGFLKTQLPTLLSVVLLAVIPFFRPVDQPAPTERPGLSERTAGLVNDYAQLRREMTETRQRLERMEQTVASTSL